MGSTSLLVTLFTGFLIGMGAGVNVRVAHGLGAGNQKETEETIHSSFLICLVTGLLICVVGLTSSRAFLALLHTKDELMEGAVNYLQIYSLGMPAMGLYNFGNGVMSARGDTKRPLVYLLIAGVLNVIMNLIFVIGFHMAAEGVDQVSYGSGRCSYCQCHGSVYIGRSGFTSSVETAGCLQTSASQGVFSQSGR